MITDNGITGCASAVLALQPHRRGGTKCSIDCRTKMSLKTPQEINEMWFGPDRTKFNDPNFIKSLMGKWFSRTVPEVETTFISEKDEIDRLIDEANLDEKWFTPEGYLARIVMFDQGSRTAFRGTPKAFAFDPAATALALDIIQNKDWFFEKYLPIERQAILTPLLHAEDMFAQRVATQYVQKLCEGVDSPELQAFFRGVAPFFDDHAKVVEQFGRFPSRNAALGRASTAEEEAWLNSPDLPDWAKSQQPTKQD